MDKAGTISQEAVKRARALARRVRVAPPLAPMDAMAIRRKALQAMFPPTAAHDEPRG